MSKLIDDLNAWGCDTMTAMERLKEDERFYKECLDDIPIDPNFELLGNALRSHDIKQAFFASHSLKGALASLELTPMYNTVVKIVEPLRIGNDYNLIDEYNELLDQRKRLEVILNTTNS